MILWLDELTTHPQRGFWGFYGFFRSLEKTFVCIPGYSSDLDGHCLKNFLVVEINPRIPRYSLAAHAVQGITADGQATGSPSASGCFLVSGSDGSFAWWQYWSISDANPQNNKSIQK